MFVPLLWVKEAFVGLFRNFWWNLAAFVLTFVCLMGFSLSFIAGNNAEHVSNVINEKLTIQVDIKEEVTNYSELRKDILADSRVEAVEFISKEETHEMMVKEMGEDAAVLEIFDGNIFLAQFVVHLYEPAQVESVAKMLEKKDYANKVLYGKEYAKTLLSFTSKFETAGMYVTIASGLTVIFLVMLAIKMNIEQRKDEIKIKQLIGSSMLTIKAPFILEALLLMGAASTATYYAFIYLYERIESYVQQKFVNEDLQLLSSVIVREDLIIPLFGLALALGFLGSLLSTTRKLKRI